MPIDIDFNESENNNSKADKIYNDQNYYNIEGDKLLGDININGNKLILSDNSKIYDSQKELIFDTSKFLFTNILSGDSNQSIVFNKRITNIGLPIENNDAVTKRYSDLRVSNINMQNNRLIFGSQNNLQLSNLNPSISSNRFTF